jgi:hypothetical protein
MQVKIASLSPRGVPCPTFLEAAWLDAGENLRIYWGFFIIWSCPQLFWQGGEAMSYQMFTDGLMIGFLAGILFCAVAYRFTSQRRGRSTRREIDTLVQQFQDHFRNTRRGDGEKIE